jgi:hypothetical protein
LPAKAVSCLVIVSFRATRRQSVLYFSFFPEALWRQAMLNPRIFILCIFFFAVCSSPMNAQALDIGGALKSVQSAGEFSKTLEGYYNQLMGFKDDASFHNAGSEASSEYGEWQGNVRDLGKDAGTEAQKGATDQLLQLGDAYQDSKGAETDLTKTLTQALSSFF